MSIPSDQFESVNKAFTKQSGHFDVEDLNNLILQNWRKQIYEHVSHFLKPNSNILELNAGTGIDAVQFVKEGHRVHATDLSDGMIEQLKRKSTDPLLSGRLTYQQLSFDQLDLVEHRHFDYIFSNFGGLNCIDDLGKVTVHFKSLLNAGGCITLVIMPPVCPWEIISALKGNARAFRRFNRNGTRSHLEGEYFRTYYHSLSKIKNSLGRNFHFLKAEGLGIISPPPSSIDFLATHQTFYKLLVNLNSRIRNLFPFYRWGDHIIVSFQLKT